MDEIVEGQLRRAIGACSSAHRAALCTQPAAEGVLGALVAAGHFLAHKPWV